MKKEVVAFCHYCGVNVAYKSDGNSKLICYHRAHYGTCEGLQPRHVPPQTGRNEPCGCGSGKKFKKCCLNEKINIG